MPLGGPKPRNTHLNVEAGKRDVRSEWIEKGGRTAQVAHSTGPSDPMNVVLHIALWQIKIDNVADVREV